MSLQMASARHAASRHMGRVCQAEVQAPLAGRDAVERWRCSASLNPYTPDDRLGQLWSSLEAGWAALVRGSGWTADKQAYGVRAYIPDCRGRLQLGMGLAPALSRDLLLDQRLEQPTWIS